MVEGCILDKGFQRDFPFGGFLWSAEPFLSPWKEMVLKIVSLSLQEQRKGAPRRDKTSLPLEGKVPSKARRMR